MLKPWIAVHESNPLQSKRTVKEYKILKSAVKKGKTFLQYIKETLWVASYGDWKVADPLEYIVW